MPTANIDPMVQDATMARWRAALAPTTGDIRRELAAEAAEYLGLSLEDTLRRIEQSATDFPDEWKRMVTDPSDPEQVDSLLQRIARSELFEQIAWHASDQSIIDRWCVPISRRRSPAESSLTMAPESDRTHWSSAWRAFASRLPMSPIRSVILPGGDASAAGFQSGPSI